MIFIYDDLRDEFLGGAGATCGFSGRERGVLRISLTDAEVGEFYRAAAFLLLSSLHIIILLNGAGMQQSSLRRAVPTVTFSCPI